MSSMFKDAIRFNQPLNFDTKNVEDMTFMFENARNFDQKLDFDTSNLTNGKESISEFQNKK